MRRLGCAGLLLLSSCAAPSAGRPHTDAGAPSAAGDRSAGSAAASSSAASASSAGSPAWALEQEIGRVAARAANEGSLWPGFDPRATPLAVFDGRKTWFFRHPSPPAGCQPVEGGACVVDGRHEAMTANSSAEIGGTTTATVLLDKAGTKRPVLEQAALAIHEDFHVFQRTRHAGWVGNEADLFTYPADAPDLLATRRLETEALRRALATGESEEARCWARRALALRHERQGGMDAVYSAYERGTELNEGLASYIQTRAAGRDTVTFPDGEFGPAEVRPRAYVTGAALALLLDRLSPGWKERLEADDAQTLDGLLAGALGPDTPADGCPFPEGAETRAKERARADIALRASELAHRLAAFETRPGWRVIVEAADGRPLRAQGFDPLNVERIAAGRVLHTRYVALGNEAGRLEVMDAEALTDGVGPHPLFGGVKRVVVTGLPNPEVREAGGRVTVTAPGLTLDFQGGTVTRDGQAMTVRLGVL